MPKKIKLASAPIGFSVHSAVAGEAVKVISSGLLSTDDGELLNCVLDSLSDLILVHRPEVPPSSIENLIAIIEADGTCDLYINEAFIKLAAVCKSDLKPGSSVNIDDLVEVRGVEIEGITFPASAGVTALLTNRWRRLLVFDLRPLLPGNTARSCDFRGSIAGAIAMSIFRYRTGITGAHWDQFESQGWFPFVGMPIDLIREMKVLAERGRRIDDLLGRIVENTSIRTDGILSAVSKTPALSGHVAVITQATKHSSVGEYMSCSALVYPRIDGIVRDHARGIGVPQTQRQKSLSQIAVNNPTVDRGASSPLLPTRFSSFLESVVFAGFDPASPGTDVNRNTVVHGVVDQAAFASPRWAVIGLLTIEQLTYFMR